MGGRRERACVKGSGFALATEARRKWKKQCDEEKAREVVRADERRIEIEHERENDHRFKRARRKRDDRLAEPLACECRGANCEQDRGEDRDDKGADRIEKQTAQQREMGADESFAGISPPSTMKPGIKAYSGRRAET